MVTNWTIVKFGPKFSSILLMNYYNNSIRVFIKTCFIIKNKNKIKIKSKGQLRKNPFFGLSQYDSTCRRWESLQNSGRRTSLGLEGQIQKFLQSPHSVSKCFVDCGASFYHSINLPCFSNTSVPFQGLHIQSLQVLQGFLDFYWTFIFSKLYIPFLIILSGNSEI